MNKIDAVGDSHWRSDWMESQHDEMVLVIRPKRKILVFNLHLAPEKKQQHRVGLYIQIT